MVGAPRRVSDFRDEPGVVDSAWRAMARAHGLGSVARVVSLVTIESSEQPASRLVVRYASRVVDGFLGIEQLASVTPRLVRGAIERALEAGWRASGARHAELEIEADDEAPAALRPKILVIPEVSLVAPEGYPRVVRVRRIR